MQRDQVCRLAKTDPQGAHEVAKRITDPWFRAQSLSWVARFSETERDALVIARQAAKTAAECDDDYQRSSVRAWELAVLGERGHKQEAKNALKASVALAISVQPVASRCEALFLLFQAAFAIDRHSAEAVFASLEAACPREHWRCERALRQAEKMLAGEVAPRAFFW